MHARVMSVTWVTSAMVRVELGGEGLEQFQMSDSTDAYVNIAVPPPGAPYGPVFEPAEVREAHDKAWWPARRRFTVRSWDPARRRLAIDFVVHGDEGVAGRWAAGAVPGDVLVLEGPGSGYRPDPTADWHLMVGDESALPAIAASLAVVPAGRTVVVRLVCDDPTQELPLESPGELDVRWLHRVGSEDPANLLVADLEQLEFPPGRVHAFVHGEAEEVRAIRHHLLADRGLSRSEMSCSPYWRRTMTDDAWRVVKADFVAAMEADVAPATS